MKKVKWIDDDNIICVADIRSWNEITNSGIANYYRKGKLYAPLQKFILKEDDIEISEEEFNKYLENEGNI